ncbi:M23 family metallopeptidase [Hoylesella pleuritidis]|uniref:M23 family metallopeptidase n=1 Tax=Hoylesella pleuritidis TaxID=407975 RepID=UPI0028F11489|nr:M23 family metallopeptidase [Hoylesella pleuritidis]
MRIRKTIKTIAVTAILALTAQSAVGQDLLARQAPVDRKMRRVDTLALQSIINRETAQSPAADLYNDWDNRYAHRATELPDSFRINLRHFHMPTPSRVITSNFGARWGRMHKGIDIKVYVGDTIRSAFAGKVRIVRYEAGGYGKYIVIRHPNGLETIYGHLSKQLVEENQEVRAGEVIGLGGNTGRSTGSHLHFETRLCGVALNPALLFDFRAQDITADTYMFRRSSYERESAEATRLRGKIGNGGYSRDEVTGEIAQNNYNSASFNGEKLFHKVEAGETLASIARKRGVTIDQLCKLNHLNRNTRVSAGRMLRYS